MMPRLCQYLINKGWMEFIDGNAMKNLTSVSQEIINRRRDKKEVDFFVVVVVVVDHFSILKKKKNNFFKRFELISCKLWSNMRRM